MRSNPTHLVPSPEMHFPPILARSRRMSRASTMLSLVSLPRRALYAFQRSHFCRNVVPGSPRLRNQLQTPTSWNGPSFYLDVACGSSLMAAHLAIRLIEAGDCDVAVITGCQHKLRYVHRILAFVATHVAHLRSPVCWEWWYRQGLYLR